MRGVWLATTQATLGLALFTAAWLTSALGPSWLHQLGLPRDPAALSQDVLERPPWLADARPSSAIAWPSAGGHAPQEDREVPTAAPFVLAEHPHNRLRAPGAAADADEVDLWKRAGQDVWRLFILFQHNYPMLQQAVESFERASAIVVPHTVVVDNSAGKEALASPWLRERVAEVVATPQPLNFPQLHNFMATLALARGLTFYFWAHADNYVLALAPDRDLGMDVIDCLREQIAQTPDWGMVLFAYDHLAAYRTQALVQVPWDPHVFQYGSECDAYGRLRDAGYAVRACKVHHSYDMKRVMPTYPEDTWHTLKERLENVETQLAEGRNQWRETAIGPEEQAWRTAMKAYSRTYLTAKWGEVKCKLHGLPCRKPWPLCVAKACPPQAPLCYTKEPLAPEQLRALHAAVHAAMDADQDQPPKPPPWPAP